MAPSTIVIVRAMIVFFRLASMSEWWAHVTVNPEAKRVMVLSRGTSNGSSGKIPLGGHCIPIFGDGLKLRKKNDQNMPKKNRISDVMNRIIP